MSRHAARIACGRTQLIVATPSPWYTTAPDIRCRARRSGCRCRTRWEGRRSRRPRSRWAGPSRLSSAAAGSCSHVRRSASRETRRTRAPTHTTRRWARPRRTHQASTAVWPPRGDRTSRRGLSSPSQRARRCTRCSRSDRCAPSTSSRAARQDRGIRRPPISAVLWLRGRPGRLRGAAPVWRTARSPRKLDSEVSRSPRSAWRRRDGRGCSQHVHASRHPAPGPRWRRCAHWQEPVRRGGRRTHPH